MRDARFTALGWGIAGVLGAGAITVLAWAALMPYDAASSDASPNARPLPSSTGLTDPPVSAFARVWDIELSRPLVDTPHPPAMSLQTAPAVPKSPPGLKLVGTVVESSHSMAVFIRADGKSEVRGIGERSAGAEVLAIEGDRVTLRYNGQPIVLRVEKGPKG